MSIMCEKPSRSCNPSLNSGNSSTVPFPFVENVVCMGMPTSFLKGERIMPMGLIRRIFFLTTALRVVMVMKAAYLLQVKHSCNFRRSAFMRDAFAAESRSYRSPAFLKDMFSDGNLKESILPGLSLHWQKRICHQSLEEAVPPPLVPCSGKLPAA